MAKPARKVPAREPRRARGSVQYINPPGLLKNRAYTQVVVASGPVKTVYVGAQTAVDDSGAIVGRGDVAAQTEQILRNMEVTAREGESVLRRILETDDGSARLGEVALVPHRSPIARSGLLFYNTLIDENAASHLALGQGYRSTLQDGDGLSDAGFAAAGGNRSLVHVDFMIGSGDIDVDGVTAEGRSEAVLRQGEWVR